jgi:hypothetical protein
MEDEVVNTFGDFINLEGVVVRTFEVSKTPNEK